MSRGPSLSDVGASQGSEPSLTIGECIRGKGLSRAAAAGVVLVLLAQVAIEFRVARARPAPESVRRWYPAELHGQVEDVVAWVDTGLLLPAGAIPVRSPRPLYPFIVTVGKWAGLFSPFPPTDRPEIIHRGIQILLAANIAFSIASGWLFLAACRRFGLALLPALCATIVALSGRGFSHYTAQAIPEVLTYFASIVCILAGLLAVEAEARGVTGKRLVAIWSVVGILVGLFLLGKEVYWLVLMGAVWLSARKAWRPLAGFLLASLLPTTAWLYYIVRVIRVFDPADYYPHYQFVTWLFTDLLPAPAAGKIELLGANLTRQVVSFLQAFIWVPVLLACVGAVARRPKHAGAFLGLFFLSQYVMFLASNFVRDRLMFWTWPVVYFFAWSGVEWIAERSSESSRVVRWSLRLAALVFLVWLQTRPFTDVVFFN